MINGMKCIIVGVLLITTLIGCMSTTNLLPNTSTPQTVYPVPFNDTADTSESTPNTSTPQTVYPVPSNDTADTNESTPSYMTNRVYASIAFDTPIQPLTAPQALMIHLDSTFDNTITTTVSISLTTSGIRTTIAPSIINVLVPGGETVTITTTFQVEHEGFIQVMGLVSVEPLLSPPLQSICPTRDEYYISRAFLVTKIGIFQNNQWGDLVDNYLRSAVENYIITPDEYDAIQRERSTINNNNIILQGIDGPIGDPAFVDVPELPIPYCSLEVIEK